VKLRLNYSVALFFKHILFFFIFISSELYICIILLIISWIDHALKLDLICHCRHTDLIWVIKKISLEKKIHQNRVVFL